jgi:hypothetical protein
MTLALLTRYGNPNDLANTGDPDYNPAHPTDPRQSSHPIESPTRSHDLEPSAAQYRGMLEEPRDPGRPVGFDFTTSPVAPWLTYPPFDGSYGVVVRVGADPQLVGGMAPWDVQTTPIPRNEPRPWDAY